MDTGDYKEEQASSTAIYLSFRLRLHSGAGGSLEGFGVAFECLG